MRKLPKHVHKKAAKGRTYYYFNTGKGLSRLPDIRHRDFPKALQNAQAQRTKKQGPEGVKSFDWLCRLYEKSPEWRALKDASRALYSRHLGYANENLRNAQGYSAPLTVITAEQIVAIRDKFAHQPGTANGILKAVGSLYAWAGTKGRKYVKENVASEIERLEEGEHEPWPEWLIEDALDDPAVRLPVALLYFVGQRTGDTVRMGPQNIVGGSVHFTQQKTGTALRIPLHSRLLQIIEADAPKGAMLFLLNERGKPMTGPALRARLQKWAATRGQKIVPHGLRKNAVNALLESGCSAAEVSAVTGQSMAMIEHYAKKRDREHLAGSAIVKFEARNKTGTGGERENGT
jgi:integrase